jgi:PAS domain S-box-containing protein
MLEKTRMHIESVFDYIPEMITIHDRDYNIVYANEAAVKKLGTPSLKNTKCYRYYHETDSPPKGCKSCECLKTGEPVEFEVYDSRLGMFMEIKAIPRLDKKGQIEGIVHIIRDITEKKNLEDSMMRMTAEWERTFDSIEDLIMLTDREGKILHVNEAFTRNVGLQFNEVIGSRCYRVFHGTDEPPKHCPRLKMISGHKVKKAELYEPGPNGYYHINIFPYFDSSNRLTGTIHVVRDITHVKEAVEAIRESENKYRVLINDANDAIFITDIDGNITDANKKAEAYMGYDISELKGLHITGLHASGFYEVATEIYKSVVKKGSVRCLEVPFQRKDGRTFFANISGSYIEYEDKKISQIMVSDITELKKARDALSESEDKLRRSERLESIGKLAAGVAHEVRNPLNAIMALTDALFVDIGDDPEYMQYHFHMRSQVNRLSELMEDLLELGRPPNPAKMKRHDLAGLCSDIVEMWDRTDIARACEVRMTRPSGGNALEVLCEDQRLQQIFLNLLDNAAQHSPEGSVIQFTILEPADGAVSVQVIDRGSGIYPEVLTKVFDPFYTSRKKGTGLGLSIVKNIIDNLGGSILIENNDPPPGCKVEVRLPVAGTDEY